MMPARTQRSAGFTLVEVLIGSTLGLAVLTAVLSSYIYMGRQLARLANQQTLETEGRRTLGYFEQDVSMATGTTSTLSASRVSLTVPAATNTNTITYYYNSTSSDAVVSVNGSNVTMVANALTRCVYDGTTVTPQTLLRNITSSGLTLRYYDSSGTEYTSYANYLSGIKQLSLEAGLQTGNRGNGTQTPVYRLTSNRLVLRNRPFLP